MQPIDALTLQHLAAELDLKLADGKINKIQQASHHEVLLHLWVGGQAGRQKLYINIQPQYAFCALVEDTSFLTFPAVAPNFCMVLRKHLTGARIKQVNTLPDERVLNLVMDNYNELGQQVHLVLSIELMGKNSNIILYDEELRMIIGCAHGVSEKMSRIREISVGYPYAPPPRPDRIPIRYAPRCDVTDHIEAAYTQQSDPAAVLTQAYTGVGKAVLSDIFEHFPDADVAYDTLMSLYRGEQLYPAIKKDLSQFSLLAVHQGEPDWQPQYTLNAMIAQFFLTHLLQDRVQARRQQWSQVLKAQEKKVLKRRGELEKSAPEAVKALKKAGDLLTLAYSQHQSPHGARITVIDYDTQQPITLDLDPGLTLAENAQHYYRRYKKAQTRQTMAQHLAQELDRTLAYIQELHHALDRAASWDDLASIREDLEAQGWLKPEPTPKKGAKPAASAPLILTSSDGFSLLVGRNNLQNDQIAGRLSKPEDVWLHTHLIPGSHVLIKTDKRHVPDTTLAEAAMLAVYFSQARDSVNVPVVYTKAQYVRKIPGSYPGHVNYTHEQALHITPDPATLATLLQPLPKTTAPS